MALSLTVPPLHFIIVTDAFTADFYLITYFLPLPLVTVLSSSCLLENCLFVVFARCRFA